MLRRLLHEATAATTTSEALGVCESPIAGASGIVARLAVDGGGSRVADFDHAGMPRLTGADVQAGVDATISGELCKHSHSEAKKALEKWRKLAKGTPLTAEAVGLQFDPAHVAALAGTRSFAPCGAIRGVLLTAEAAVMLATILEYLTAEVLELAGNAARDNKSGIITPRHINLAVREDEELDKLFPGTVRDGGVLPNIHRFLVPQSRTHLSPPERKAAVRRLDKELEALEPRAGTERYLRYVTSATGLGDGCKLPGYDGKHGDDGTYQAWLVSQLKCAANQVLVNPLDGRHVALLDVGSANDNGCLGGGETPLPYLNFNGDDIPAVLLECPELDSACVLSRAERRRAARAALDDDGRAVLASVSATDVLPTPTDGGAIALEDDVATTERLRAIKARLGIINDGPSKLWRVTTAEYDIVPDDIFVPPFWFHDEAEAIKFKDKVISEKLPYVGDPEDPEVLRWIQEEGVTITRRPIAGKCGCGRTGCKQGDPDWCGLKPLIVKNAVQAYEVFGSISSGYPICLSDYPEQFHDRCTHHLGKPPRERTIRLHAIRKAQRDVTRIVATPDVARVVHGISRDIAHHELRFTPEAFAALHEVRVALTTPSMLRHL